MAARHALKWARQARIGVRLEGERLVIDTSRSCFGPGATESIVQQLIVHKAGVVHALDKLAKAGNCTIQVRHSPRTYL